MKLQPFFLGSLLGLTSLMSCLTQAEWSDNTILPQPAEEEPVAAYLNLQLQTRSGSPDDLPGENLIRSAGIHILNGDSTYDEITPYVYIVQDTNRFAVKVTPGEKIVVVTANFNSSHLKEYWKVSQWEDILHNRFIANPTGSPATPGDIFPAWMGIPITGRATDYVEGGEWKVIPVDGMRVLSRLNAPTANGTVVSLNTGEKERLERETGKTFGEDLSFHLDAHIVINGPQRFKLFPKYGVENEYERWSLEGWMKVQFYHLSEYDEQGQLISAYTGDRFLTGGEPAYVYENTPRPEEYDEQKQPVSFDRSTVCAFIIKGRLTDGVETATRYWRINIAKNSILNGHPVASYQILRNAIYNTNIQNVLTAGYETPEEAEGEKPVIPAEGDVSIEVEVKVSDWKVYKEKTDM